MTTPSSQLLPIPKVPKQYLGMLGNLPDVDPAFFARSIWRLTELYGDIFELDLVQRKIVVISNCELIKDVADDERFEKMISGTLTELRPLIKDGLFTAFPQEMNWHMAHRILMPVFGPLAIRKMFDQQLDIAGQMMLKWDRLGERHEIACSDDFTRLAFDTIGLCAFNYRFNNFYSDEMHPFANQMADALIEAGKRSTRTGLENQVRYFSERTYHQNITSMHKLCDEIVEERVKHPQPQINDLLNVMLNLADPETGEKLDKENIRYQMATFLIAGHETTSGTLSFLFYHLLKNPDIYMKAQKEVDEVVGNEALTVSHLPKLKYIDACIKETLRYQGPITILLRHAKNPEVIAGKYPIDPSITIVSNLKGLHHDHAVWGDDEEVFRPERMLDMSKIPPGAYKPFGTGIRSCIGRAFSEQEMIINAALILQRFQVQMADPSYNLELKSTLTVKPDGFNIRVKRRDGKGDMVGLTGTTSTQDADKHMDVAKTSTTTRKLLCILYGSNAGTCKAYAEDLAQNVEQIGYAPEMRILDSATERLPSQTPVVIIQPSYEGRPADNAKKFASWLDVNSDTKKSLEHVQYTVFGVGNSEWAATFHKVPKQTIDRMDQMGAGTFHEHGFVDVKGDTIGPWERWCERLIQKLAGHGAAAVAKQSDLKVEIEKPTPSATDEDKVVRPAYVKENMRLDAGDTGPVKMHMEIELPGDVNYQAGDYVVIQPTNHRDTVRRVLHRFNLKATDNLNISGTKKAFLTTTGPESVHNLLSTKVELNTPATQRQIEKLCEFAKDNNQKSELEGLVQDKTYSEEVLPKRFSVLDLLEDYPSCELPFSDYLDMLKPLSPRQYSISSSPLASALKEDTVTVSITYDVHRGAAWSGHDRTFHGVASSYLASLSPDNQISCILRKTDAAFHLPKKSETPVIMICAGSGIAPMRGFIQERSALASAGQRDLGPALLYFGCRDYESDFIYEKELKQWEEQGVVSVRPCFSRRGPPDAKNYHYTSDRIYAEREEVACLFREGAKIFICGSASRIAKSTADTCLKIWMEMHPEKTESEATEWLDAQKEDRYVSDVFG